MEVGWRGVCRFRFRQKGVKMDRGCRGVTFLWHIENYSFCSHEKGEALLSPDFKPEGLEGTSWYLCLYPRGATDEHKGFISLYLRRWSDNGPEYVSIKFQLSVLAEDGSALSSKEYDHSFRGWNWQGSGDFLKMDESLYLRKLPRDVLTVRCKMWRGEGEVPRLAPICIRTCIVVETISFRHEVDNFSALKPNRKHTIRIPSPLKREYFVTSSLYFTVHSCPAGEMIFEIKPTDSSYILCKRKISLIGSENIILRSVDDNRFDVEKRDIRKLPLSFTRQKIVNKKNEYLPRNELTLHCECSFSTRDVFHQMNVEHEMPIAVPDQDINKNSRKISTYSSALEDIKTLYVNRSLTDVKRKTKTKSFAAHKLVLCARSPVFNRMLTNDMKERTTACIEVDDLGDDVVQQLLLFLYSDTVQSLEWTMATRLYYAADKYEIGRLKAVCSSFLVEHLNPTNAGELLLLADTLSDVDLKGEVEDFILEHEEELFGSEEWEMLLKTNPVLAGETMLLKYKRKKNQVNEIEFKKLKGNLF
ncbi:unnamed protein product [Larinioides sclopetarius]|uniref:Speckle-type POZ protein n=1 Tax=Larinioides sclopetarius TaxID=280406 RepID=A0AAV2AD08_9ARAC